MEDRPGGFVCIGDFLTRCVFISKRKGETDGYWKKEFGTPHANTANRQGCASKDRNSNLCLRLILGP